MPQGGKVIASATGSYGHVLCLIQKQTKKGFGSYLTKTGVAVRSLVIIPDSDLWGKKANILILNFHTVS